MNSTSIQDRLNTAIKLHSAGHIEEAEPIYRQVLAADPRQPDVLHLLGVIAHQRGNPSAALPLIEPAIQLRPREVPYWNNLGLALDALGRQNVAWEQSENYRHTRQIRGKS